MLRWSQLKRHLAVFVVIIMAVTALPRAVRSAVSDPLTIVGVVTCCGVNMWWWSRLAVMATTGIVLFGLYGLKNKSAKVPKAIADLNETIEEENKKDMEAMMHWLGTVTANEQRWGGIRFINALVGNVGANTQLVLADESTGESTSTIARSIDAMPATQRQLHSYYQKRLVAIFSAQKTLFETPQVVEELNVETSDESESE